MREHGFDDFASLEPHLLHAGESEGYSGPDGFTEAAAALRDILERVGSA